MKSIAPWNNGASALCRVSICRERLLMEWRSDTIAPEEQHPIGVVPPA